METTDSPQDHAQFYIEMYQTVDPKDNPIVARAYRVFDQVRLAADKPGKYMPKLVVINSSGNPWAIALPDGVIVLSKRAVEIAYLDVHPQQGDARLAFILGHELAHLVNNDFWHRDVYRALAGASDPQSKALRNIFVHGADVLDAKMARRLAAIKIKEAKADDQGFLYAALAGYAVDALLGEASKGKPDFFQHWMRQTQTRVDREHPEPRERAQLLKVRLEDLAAKLPFFDYGVRLMHFGNYEDAEYFLRAFQKTFPSREVFSNLGYDLLQQAREVMPTPLAHQYCFPLRVDIQSRASALLTRRDGVEAGRLPAKARSLLQEAASYLERARESDALYLPARLNLAVTYFYLGEIFKARAVIEEARALAPKAEEVQNLRALILYQDQLTVDMWPAAMRILENMATTPNASWCPKYNLAQILEERGRDAKALPLWQHLAGKLAELPRYYRQNVCTHATAVSACQHSSISESTAAPVLPWPLPVRIGLDLLDSTHPENCADKVFAGWKSIAFDWQQKGLKGRIYRHPKGASALVLDGFVEKVVLRGKDLGTAKALLQRSGAPTAKSVVTSGTIWSYGTRWAALVQDGEVREVWVTQ